MNTSRIIAIAGGLAAIGAVGTAVHLRSELKDSRAERAALRQELTDLRDQRRELESRLTAEKKRAEATEHDNSRLRAAIVAATSAKPDADAALTRDAVEERFRQGMAWVREGKWEAGLAELLWCYDVGMVRIGALTNTRNNALIERIADLGEKYPPALAALRERRDAQENRVLAPNCGFSVVFDYAALNGVLGEGEKTLVVYDTMPASDDRKSVLGLALLDEFVEARRYSDVARQYPDGMFLGQIEAALAKGTPAVGPGGERSLTREQRVACDTACKHVEVLAGAGEFAQTEALLRKLLSVDDSAQMRALLARHLARAGHPELLPQ